MGILNIFDPAPHIRPIQDSEEVKSQYGHWRFRIFYSMFLGYAFYYITRGCLAAAIPSITQDLGFTKTDFGWIGTLWAVTYGCSKFVSGVIGDRSNARFFMTIGLLLTGICNILFAFFSSLPMFALCWGLNGWFQGFGWPSCARLLTHWYSQNERGRWWSLWNTSHNLGGALIPLITAILAQYYGWRYAMMVPAGATILMSFFLMNRLGDTPQSVGLPPIEKFRNDYPTTKKRDDERELSVKEILFTYVLNNAYLWLLAVGAFFIYIVRMALFLWSFCYLVEAKGYSQLQAGSIVFCFDFGGIFGSITAGFASDKIFKGRRGPINVLFSLGVAAVLIAFSSFTAQNVFIDSMFIFSAGFFIYGPQMLIGMQATEVSHKKAAATATGFAGWTAYLGTAVANYPATRVIQDFGWSGFLTALIACSLIAVVLLLPLWSVRSRKEEDELARERVVSSK